MNLITLPNDILIKIIITMHDPDRNNSKNDRANLFAIIVCNKIRDIIRNNWEEIVGKYTITTIDIFGAINYYFCGRLHREGDKPASIRRHINPHSNCLCEYWKYYRHGRLHRDGGKPAVINRYYDRCDWFEYGRNISSQSPIPKHYLNEVRNYGLFL